jgi:hypothetical protein
MDSRHVTAEQAERLHKALGAHLRYLGRLHARMEKVGFVPGDPLFERVKKAHDAMHDLTVHVHYMECEASRREKGYGT